MNRVIAVAMRQPDYIQFNWFETIEEAEACESFLRLFGFGPVLKIITKYNYDKLIQLLPPNIKIYERDSVTKRHFETYLV